MAQINIRVAYKNDQGQILNLLNEVFSSQQRSAGTRGVSFWNWKFENNVFGKAKLIIAEHENKVIATSTLWPWEFSLRGQILRAYQPCDTVVHPDFQGKGLFKKINLQRLKESHNEQIDLLFNFPNKNSLNGYLSLGWENLGQLPWMVRLLKPFSVLKNYFKETKSVNLHINQEYHIEQNIAESLAQSSCTWDKFIQINRKQGFFEWRYIDKPGREYGMIKYEKGRKKIIAVFTLSQSGMNVEMIIVDLIGEPDLFHDLVDKILKEGSRMNVSYIALPKNPRYECNKLIRKGFMPLKRKNMVCLPLNPYIENKLCDFSSWDFVLSIHDSI